MTEDCLHCVINHVIDEHNERIHAETGKPVNAEGVIDDLIACVAELIAYCEDAKARKNLAKRTAKLLIERVTAFRAEGRFPGGPGEENGLLMH